MPGWKWKNEQTAWSIWSTWMYLILQPRKTTFTDMFSQFLLLRHYREFGAFGSFRWAPQIFDGWWNSLTNKQISLGSWNGIIIIINIIIVVVIVIVIVIACQIPMPICKLSIQARGLRVIHRPPKRQAKAPNRAIRSKLFLLLAVFSASATAHVLFNSWSI